MISDSTQDLKAICSKHGIPMMVAIAIDPISGDVKLNAIGATPSFHKKAEDIMLRIRRILTSSGVFK